MTSSSAKKSSTSTRMWREKKKTQKRKNWLGTNYCYCIIYVFEVQGSSDTFFKGFNVWF